MPAAARNFGSPGLRKAARAVHAGEESYRRFVETTHDGICLLDEQARIVFANSRMCEMLGYGYDELIGRDVRSLLQEPATGLDLAGSIASRSAPHELALKHSRGDAVWVGVRGAPMVNEAGEPSGVLTMFSDVTERRLSEDLVRRSEARFRALVEHASDVVAILDPNGRVLYESPAMRKLVGRRRGGYPSNEPFAEIHPDDLAGLAADFNTLTEGRATTLPLAGRFKHADGTWHYAEGVGTNLVNDPAVGGIVINFRDVTERTLAEQRAHQAADQLMQAQLDRQAKSLALLRDRERIAMDLHDGVIQSLYGIALRLSALRRRASPRGSDQTGELDTVLSQAVSQLTETIEGIRDYIYDLRTGAPENSDLKGGLATLSDEVGKSGVRTRLHLEADVSHLSPEVVNHLLYIAHEALSNVVRHAAATNADIMVLPVEGAGMVLTIADDGQGFDPDRRGRHLGDGLHNIRQRARLIGGRLTVDSQVGSGTIVSVRIP